jgi:D-glycero-D-manno-heptose 1,7-bisphosphate phosphatase
MIVISVYSEGGGGAEMIAWLGSPERTESRVILLDRDGVLNVNRVDYIKSPEEVCFYPDALQALGMLGRQGVEVILISNQSGVNRGYITWKNFWRIHQGVVDMVEEQGGKVLAAFYCPHRPDEKCDCRKPAPGMIQAACRFAGVEPGRTFFVGDSITDMEAAQNAGCPGIMIRREDAAARQDISRTPAEPVFSSLLDAVLSAYR